MYLTLKAIGLQVIFTYTIHLKTSHVTKLKTDGTLLQSQLTIKVRHHLMNILITEVLGKHRRITRRDHVVGRRFPGLLEAVGLPPGEGRWEE